MCCSVDMAEFNERVQWFLDKNHTGGRNGMKHRQDRKSILSPPCCLLFSQSEVSKTQVDGVHTINKLTVRDSFRDPSLTVGITIHPFNS
jgi:hypothetical protein